MRMIRNALPAAAFLSACAGVAPPPASSLTVDALRSLPSQTYVLDPASARMGFQARPLGFPAVTGEFKDFDGTVTIVSAANEAIDVEAVVDLSSVTIGSEWYENVIKSKAWFDVENHPEAVFQGALKGWTNSGVGSVEGMLTIRGVTRPASFEIVLDCEDLRRCPRDNVGFIGEIELSRAAYGMTAFRGLVRDEVRLTVAGRLSAGDAERFAAAEVSGSP